MAFANTYHIADIIAALQNAESHRSLTESTGKTEYIDIVVDAEVAVDLAVLTEHQQLVTNLRWTVGLTQEETATFIGCSQQSVWEAEKAAKRKVQSVLYKWGKTVA